MRYFLGVDGGGSKCDAVVIDETGVVCGWGTSGPTTYVSAEEAAAASRQALTGALAKAPARLRVAVAEGCLDCAEKRLAEGKPDEAVALYQAVAKADLPKHFKIAAAQGMILARQKPDKR